MYKTLHTERIELPLVSTSNWFTSETIGGNKSFIQFHKKISSLPDSSMNSIVVSSSLKLTNDVFLFFSFVAKEDFLTASTGFNTNE